MNRNETGILVFKSEPILKALSRLQLSPVWLGILFLLFVSLPFSAWVIFSEPLVNDETYLSYGENISWSLSLTLIFPLIIGFTLAYYHSMQRSFQGFLDIASSDEARQDIRDQMRILQARFRSRWIALTTASVSAGYNILVAHFILNQGFSGWMSSGTLLGGFSTNGGGFSFVGLVGLLLQTVLIYWVLNIFWRGAIFSFGVKKLFRQADTLLDFDPNHADRCCGFKRVGDTALILGIILFLLGAYLSLKVFDKTIVQGEPLLSDIGGLILVGGYLVLTPILFHASIAPVNGYLNRRRREFLKSPQEAFGKKLIELGGLEPGQDQASNARDLLAIEQGLKLLRRKIPVWPFNFRYSPGISILIPVFSISVSLLLASAKNIILVLRGLFLYNVTF